MIRNTVIIFLAALVIALPFMFRKEAAVQQWKPGDPELIIISAHNEAIRYEFAKAFSAWHAENFGAPVKIDWRAIGGTSEISRYLNAEFINSFRAYWRNEGNDWPAGASEVVTDRKFGRRKMPEVVRKENESDEAYNARVAEAEARWQTFKNIRAAFRGNDDGAKYSARIDLFFGGGEYDHNKAYRQGLTVPPWPVGEEPEHLFYSDKTELIPARISGETWRTPTLYGNAVSTFGICYNKDRLQDIGVEGRPNRWIDLTSPVYFRNLGMADPTKSGSVAKAFELMVHSKCTEAVKAAGFTRQQVEQYEAAIAKARLSAGELPDGVPAAYQEALEAGFMDGLRMIQLIGANARYFTDSSSKVPIDVSMGNAAAGIAIDFYGRFQSQVSITPDGVQHMDYVTPIGGSGVSCDPISLLRGAPHRELAVRFIEFVLGTDGQKLWTYKPGTPGGPEKFALRRVPIRRDFFPSDDPKIQAIHEEHRKHAADDLADPTINPYALAEEFIYNRRWTGGHFGILRDLVRTMCMDSAGELKDAWEHIIKNGGPAEQPEAMALLQRMPDVPEELNWASALAVPGSRLDYMRKWTLFFRDSYNEAKAAVVIKGSGN